MEAVAFVDQIANFAGTPAVRLEENEPVFRREFEGSVPHDAAHATAATVFVVPRRNVLNDPVTGAIECSQIVGQRTGFLKTQIGNDSFGKNQHFAGASVEAGKELAAFGQIGEIEFHALEPAARLFLREAAFL